MIWTRGWRRALCPWVLLGCLATACQSATRAPRPFPIALSAHDALGRPVAGARAWVFGQPVGRTDPQGTLELVHRGRAGSVLDLLLACPPGYRTEEPERRLPLRGDGRSAPLKVALTCTAEQPIAAVVVRAPPGLPVLVDGKRVGQTQDDGTAHLLVRGVPGTSLQITLDTSDAPDLIPQHPVTTFQIESRDQLLLVDQTFDRKLRPSRHRPKPPPIPEAPKAPQRIR